VGNWGVTDSNHPDMAQSSRSGDIITFAAGCPITRKSKKMQTQVTLSTTECEYFSLSIAHSKVIYLQQMIREMQKHGLDFTSKNSFQNI
jgi:hypothetical protein